MQPTNNALLQFLVETFKRFSAKSPKFFQIWQIISGALVLITGLPELLTMINVHLPQLWDDHLNTAIAWASRGLFFMSLLTTQSPAVAVDQDGTLLKKTNDTKLPFTASQELKTAIKNEATADKPIAKVITTS